MPVHNADIAEICEEIADLLEIEGDNPFRIRAYRNAALTGRARQRQLRRAQRARFQQPPLRDRPGAAWLAGWSKDDVLNTRPLHALLPLLQRAV